MISTKIQSVMLIDDNEIDNLINQKMIESYGYCENILMHTGAKSALEYLKNIEKVNKGKVEFLPEVIFLDIDMPLMDGFQFLEEFDKMSDATKAFCKVVMLTSSLDPKDLSKSKKSKYVSRYLNKPLTHESLKKLKDLA